MKPFRNRRDPEGKFALTTPQNPHLNNLPHFPAAQVNEQLLEIRRRADAAARQNEAASDADASDASDATFKKDVAAPAATSKSRESHTPHVPFAPAPSAAPPESHFAANAEVDEEVESKIESAPESAHSSKPRESHTPHVPFAPASSGAPSPASRAPEQLAADADLVAHLSFLQKIATQANIPLDFLSPDPLVPEPAQPLAAAPPAAPTRTFKRRPRRPPRTPASIAARVPARELTSLERHARKCQICKHPDREEIDQEFLRWQHPIFIAEEFNLPETRIIYAHARATGLFDRRGQNVRCALEFFIEEANRVDPSGDTIVRAIRAYTRINARGEWHEPPSHMIYTTMNQNVANHLNVAVQTPPPPRVASAAAESRPPAIDLDSPPSAPQKSAVAAPISNPLPAIRKQRKPLKTLPK